MVSRLLYATLTAFAAPLAATFPVNTAVFAAALAVTLITLPVNDQKLMGHPHGRSDWERADRELSRDANIQHACCSSRCDVFLSLLDLGLRGQASQYVKTVRR